MDKIIMDLNKETNQWLCHIPDTVYAWYIKGGKKKAESFCKEFNDKFDAGEIWINPNTGKLEKKVN